MLLQVLSFDSYQKFRRSCLLLFFFRFSKGRSEDLELTGTTAENLVRTPGKFLEAPSANSTENSSLTTAEPTRSSGLDIIDVGAIAEPPDSALGEMNVANR